MRHKNIKLKTALTALGLTALAAPVSAQMLEEIVVTAQKRVQGLGDVPVSMQVVSGDSLENQNIFDFKGLVEKLPNVYLGSTPGPSTISIRGVGTGAGNSAAEQSVGMYVDGAYVSRGHQFNAPFTDIERVEVLKGPQGVLQGKNSVAGAIVITTRRPTEEFEAIVRGSYEFENEGYNVEGIVSGGITDNLFGRIVVQENLVGGFLDTNTRLANDGETVLKGKDDQNEDEVSVLRLSLVWEPSDTLSLFGKVEAGERTQSGVRFGGNSFQPEAREAILDDFTSRDPNYDTIDNGVISNGFALAYNPDTNVFEATNADLDTTVDSASFTGQLDWELGGGTLTAISVYSEFELEQYLANTMSPTDFIFSSADKGDGGEEFDQFTQEIRYVSPGGETIDYIVGGFYMDRNIERDESDSITNLSNGGLEFPTFADLAQTRYFKENTESYSVFGQVTWNITDALRINAGVRYTDETKEVDHDYQGEFLVAIPPLNQLILDAFGTEFFTTEDLPVTEVSDTSTDPSASVQWDVSDGVMLYASYTEATKAGGFNSSANQPDQTSFDPETATGYELGLKGSFFDGRLAANVSIYSTAYDDLQVSALDTATNSFFFKNAAEATSEGIEGDLRYAVSDSFEIGGALAYLDATYDDFPGASCSVGSAIESDCVDGTRNAKGDKLRFAPEWTGNLYADYGFDLNNGMAVSLRGDMVYSDDYFWGGQNDDYQAQDSFSKLDISASLTSADGNWKVSLIGKNMTDETTVSFGGATPLYDGAYWSNVDAPRLIYVSAEYRWL